MKWLLVILFTFIIACSQTIDPVADQLSETNNVLYCNDDGYEVWNSGNNYYSKEKIFLTNDIEEGYFLYEKNGDCWNKHISDKLITFDMVGDCKLITKLPRFNIKECK